jgi:hypothetical protein
MNQQRRSDSVEAANERGMQSCAHCGAKFGLVRHYYLRKQFCAKTCLADYKARMRREVDTRLRQWWNEWRWRSETPKRHQPLAAPHRSPGRPGSRLRIAAANAGILDQLLVVPRQGKRLHRLPRIAALFLP